MKKRWLLCLSLLLLLGLAACATGNYGRFSLNTETEKAINAYEVNPAYRYYISGPDPFPNALLGVDRQYRLNPEEPWKEVRMTPEKLKEIVEGMKSQAFRFRHFPASYDLLDEKGHKVGIWYSVREGVTFLRTEADGTLTIDTPPLDIFLKMETPYEN